MRAAEIAMASQAGGVGIRQFGSRAACHATTRCESHRKPPARRATHTQPVKTATKPAGTINPISGTTKTLAERPEMPTR